ncbi:MAG: hypothetical protein MHPSP_003266, partial [Paramarteilia canceri]
RKSKKDKAIHHEKISGLKSARRSIMKMVCEHEKKDSKTNDCLEKLLIDLKAKKPANKCINYKDLKILRQREKQKMNQMTKLF